LLNDGCEAGLTPGEGWPPYNNGTTHVVFEPLDFLAKLAALVRRG
jgi:hypothetical protein